MDKARVIDIEDVAEENDAFRKVVFTAEKAQLVVMSLAPSEEIGLETHDADQVLYVAEGDGTATIDGTDRPLEEGAALCVPAGTEHNVINTGDEPMKIITLYAPPQHAPGTVHRTKADAEEAEHASPEPPRS